MIRSAFLLILTLLISSLALKAQEIILMDRFDDNKVVNDSVIMAFSTNTAITDLTKYFVIKNNTDQTLALFLRKTINVMADSTSDYFCFGIKCWPEEDTTNIADTIHPGAEDYNFASHVTHVRRFDMPPLPPGLTSITYTIYDLTSLPEPVEARVTVLYHLSPLAIKEQEPVVLSVYPNPVSDWLTVATGDNQNGKYDLFIYDNAGKLVLRKGVVVEQNRLKIQPGPLQTGLYHGVLLSDHSGPMTFKFQMLR